MAPQPPPLLALGQQSQVLLAKHLDRGNTGPATFSLSELLAAALASDMSKSWSQREIEIWIYSHSEQYRQRTGSLYTTDGKRVDTFPIPHIQICYAVSRFAID